MNITIAGLKMWEAVAEYADGTSVRRLFAYSEGRNENDQQYDLECWLLEHHPGCIWYSVNYIEGGNYMNPQDIRVLAACEESQAVCTAFRERGFSAWSCDIQDCSGGHPEWHIKGDVIQLLKVTKWDLIIAFPPCTDLASSGARWFEQKRKDGRQKKSIDFFLTFSCVACDHVAIENPVGIMSTIYRKPDQIINPYEHGDTVRKATCLWLKGLPPLTPTKIVDAKLYRSGGKTYSGPALYARDENGKILAWNDPRTAKIRSKTYPGIAKAMAQQWGDYLLEAIT